MDQPVKTKYYPLIVLGSGPAGYTAALYALRAGIQTLLLEGEQPGGQLMTTTLIENWPGGDSDLSGPQLMLNMEAQVDRLGATRASETALSIERLPGPKSTFLVRTQAEYYHTSCVIVATGSRSRRLNLPSEQAYFGKGVSTCATCDGFFYRDQVVAVVGGGNCAVSEAIYLSNLAKLTYLIHRRSTFRAEKLLLEQLERAVAAGKIQLALNCVVEEIIGDAQSVTHVRLNTSEQSKHTTKDPMNHTLVPTSALFLAIGHLPNTEFLASVLDLRADGTIRLQEEAGWSTQTSVPGIFAAGEVADPTYRQAIVSAGMGCMAALDAQRYLSTQVALTEV